MLFRPLDFSVAFFALSAVIASFFWVYAGACERGMVRLKGENGEWVFPLNAVETMAVSGPLGDTLVEIQGGQARIVSSPCVNQSCVASGAVHAPGQWTACLPNRVMLYIGEAQEDDVDATVW
ncbi:MAG: NusG domain II-containing protein [Treponema sp.]|jgi:hypothetical protein|nr:NusG domain II-containing protein [Treponema sp.]